MYQLINRWLHRTGERRPVFGIEIGAPRWPRSVKELALARLMEAVSLIAVRDPVRLAGMTRRATRVFAGVTEASDASFDHELNLILISLETICRRDLTIEKIALLLVHEATHARISRRGIPYSAPLRNRIERACVRAELSFAECLPDPARCLHIASISNWLQRPSPDFSDEAFVERKAREHRRLGMPEWFINWSRRHTLRAIQRRDKDRS